MFDFDDLSDAEDHLSESRPPVQQLESAHFSLGDSVKALFKGREWHRASIQQCNADGTYTIQWEDGEVKDDRKSPDELRLVRRSGWNDQQLEPYDTTQLSATDSLETEDSNQNIATQPSLALELTAPSVIADAPYVEQSDAHEESSMVCSVAEADANQQADKDVRPLKESLIHTDADGVPRGACAGCKKCASWLFPDFSLIEFIMDGEHTPEERKYTYERKMRAYNNKRLNSGTKCEGCGCPCKDHKSLESWRVGVIDRIRHLRRRLTDPGVADKSEKYEVLSHKRRLPRHARAPLAALDWNSTDAALFLVSSGLYDPRFDGRHKSIPCSITDQQGRILISVICPTSDKRQAFHPLLYECFRMQAYEPKELVVIDSGKAPSKFFQEKAREDVRVVYRFFAVGDSKETDPMAAVMCHDGVKSFTLEDVKRRKGLKFTPKRGWSLGLKRNLACHLARGSAIAHFDDDDLYAPCYLSRMCEFLLAAEGDSNKPWCPGPGSGGLRPALAKLSEWHLVDLKEVEFGYFNPQKDALLDDHRRESIRYGFGFSYMYTRAAWELVAFPDVEFSEDGEFITMLKAKSVPIKLVTSEGAHDGLAAHTHHAESTSGGEMVGQVRLGEGVPVPENFKSLIPMYSQVATASGFKRGGAHPIRQEMSKVLDGRVAPPEVGWRRKKEFLEKNPNFAKDPALEERQAAQRRAWPGVLGRGPPGKGGKGVLASGGKGRLPGFQSGAGGKGRAVPLPLRPQFF